MAQVWPVVREHLQYTQQAQARVYNRGAQVRSFQQGDWAMVLDPFSECKFLAKWREPYEVVKEVGEGNYKVPSTGAAQTNPIISCKLTKTMAQVTPFPKGIGRYPSIPKPRRRRIS